MKHLLILLLLAANAWAYTYNSGSNTYTTDGSQSDVQAAIDAAGEGATIVLPAGTFVWSTVGNGVLITAINNIRIQGAGIDQTIIDDRTDGTSTQAVFNFSNYHLAGKRFTIDGLTINHHATLYGSAGILTSAPSCIISNIKITEVVTRGIYVNSPQGNYDMANALIYNCEIRGRSADGVSQLITVIGNDYATAPTVDSTTKSSWYLPAGMGGGLATFVENSILYNSHNQDSTIETYNGGRCVVRYSTLTNFIIGAHGNDSSSRSGHTIEVYNSTINNTLGSAQPTSVNLRGGVGYFHNNTVTESGGGSTYPMTLQVYRAAGFNLTNGNPAMLALVTPAGNFVVGRRYTITVVGTTDFTAIGASANTVGVAFTATGAGTGTGRASNTHYAGRYDFVVSNGRYERAAEPGVGDASNMGITAGFQYRIATVGSTNWVAIGAASNTVGVVFTATGTGSGSGTATCTQIYLGYSGGQWILMGEGLHQLTHSADGKQDQAVGTYEASGSGDIVLASSITNQGVVRVYYYNGLNGAAGTDGNTAVTNGSGTHTGSSGVAALTDSTKSWTTNQMLGNGTAAFDDELFTYYIWNLTSGAGGFITANTATTVTAALNGGTRQTWSAGDSYVITMGHPGMDMVGRGGPTRFYDKSGNLTTSATDVRYSVQASVPCYVWSNTFNGSADTRDVAISWDGLYDATNSPYISSLVQEGREYFNNAGVPPGYTPYQFPNPLRVPPSTQTRPVAAYGGGGAF